MYFYTTTNTEVKWYLVQTSFLSASRLRRDHLRFTHRPSVYFVNQDGIIYKLLYYENFLFLIGTVIVFLRLQ